jgi:hypothetical protein
MLNDNDTLTKRQFLRVAGLAVLWTIAAGLMSCSGEQGGTVSSTQAPKCATCPMRARYDNNPRALISRIWKWHTGWCPGWKSYLSSLPEDERKKVIERYR